MRYAKRILLALAAMLSVCAVPGVAHAGPLLDWWMRKHNPQPAIAVTQPTVSYAQACCDVSACGSCGTCDTGCGTCTPGYVQQGYVQQQVVNFAPTYTTATASNYAATTAYMPTTSYMPAVTTAYAPGVGYSPNYAVAPQYRYRGFFPRYRTAWARVPVTTYRPMASVDPSTGMPVSVLQPCSTYTWQLRRVPVSMLNPAYYATSASYAPVTTQTMVVQGAAASGCASCASGGATISTTPSAATPYYGPTPAATVPSGPASTVGPAETAPADRPPSLNPNELNQGASFRPNTEPKQKSVVQPEPARTTGSVKEPAKKLDLGPGVKPVPDPDAAERRDAEPQLNNPRDLTAQAPVRRTWSYTPVSWSSSSHADETAVAPAVHQAPAVDLDPASAAASQEVTWDASGWKSIAK